MCLEARRAVVMKRSLRREKDKRKHDRIEGER